MLLFSSPILAFDTALGATTVAVLHQGKLLARASEPNQAMQAESLLPLIEEVLKSADYRYADLAALAVTIGPGSFTGVRIGLAAAKGISFAAKLPLIGVTTLEATALAGRPRASDKTTPFLAVLDARRSQYYVQGFSSDIKPLTLPQLLSAEELHALIEEKQWITVGNVPEFCNGAALPDAEYVAAVAVLKIQKGEKAEPLHPLYIRPPDAKLPKT